MTPSGSPAQEELVRAERLLAVADLPPLAPWEPDRADRGRLLPLELLAWDAKDRLIGVRCTADEVLVASGRPPVRRPVTVTRITRWARAGRVTLHLGRTDVEGGDGEGGDVEARLLAPSEYAGLSLGDVRSGRVAGPVRMARSGQRSGQRDEVTEALVARVLRVAPGVQVANG